MTPLKRCATLKNLANLLAARLEQLLGVMGSAMQQCFDQGHHALRQASDISRS
jgi:hypothetical protein